MRKDDGCLHFFVNSTDLGIAAQSVPDNVYGVVDLFGQCAQVTIVSDAQENGDVTLANTLNGKMNLINFLSSHIQKQILPTDLYIFC